MSEDLLSLRQSIESKCTDCNACKTQCEFLKTYGNPGEFVEKYDITANTVLPIAFDCSLCGSCDSVCTEKIQITDFFFQMRQVANSRQIANLKPYKPLLAFETAGRSSLLKYYKIPPHCDTIFFPGCALPGTRPDLVQQSFRFLKSQNPTMGIVLDCCLKPSYDLGREIFFEKNIEKIYKTLTEKGVKNIIVACPNCYKVFSKNLCNLKITTLYQFLDQHGSEPSPADKSETLTVHDPCPLRDQSEVHASVRRLIYQQGHSLMEMQHNRKNTVCCGEGGAVHFIKPRFANAWGQLRKRESKGKTVITYCSGCVGFLKTQVPVRHVLDLFFYPHQKSSSKESSGLMTYLNRFFLKLRLIFFK